MNTNSRLSAARAGDHCVCVWPCLWGRSMSAATKAGSPRAMKLPARRQLDVAVVKQESALSGRTKIRASSSEEFGDRKQDSIGEVQRMDVLERA